MLFSFLTTHSQKPDCRDTQKQYSYTNEELSQDHQKLHISFLSTRIFDNESMLLF
jgi:hypothetical protein